VDRGLAVTPFFTGDPVRVGARVASPSELLAALELPSVERPAFLPLAPRIALIHAPFGALELRWVELSHASDLGAGAGPIEVAIVMTAPLGESGRAVRLVGRLKAALGDAATVGPARAATTREELVRALEGIDQSADESPLTDEELFTSLRSGLGGLTSDEAAGRRGSCGANRIEHIRRRVLLVRLLEQFVSFFAILLWVGGGLAFLAGMPELGWAVFAVIAINGIFSFFQEYRAERAIQALQELLPHEIVVIRDEREARLPADDLVPGDLVRLDEGDQVPADGLIGAPQGRIESGLELLGLIALWDPPRPEVPGAIALCRRAGIRVVMVTGDYGLTAQAIARRIDLPVGKVVTGDEVERMAPATLQDLLREPGVLFARTSPAHKLAIVRALKASGEVVAVTGDGVNDAPALKAAAIGVAMGRRGTEVAREAAEMVITDDNFASIVSAIRQGRAIYANMGKFVTYIFASNVPELVPFLAFVLLGTPLPLTVMQILAVDLGTDLVPALALGAEPPEPGVMDRPPRPRDARLLGPGRLLRAYGFLGVAEAILSLGSFFWTYRVSGWRPGLPMAASGDLYRRATTMTLAGIVAAQVGNLFACRTDRESVFRVGLFANPLIWAGIVAEIAVLAGLILVPPLREVFGLAPLAFAEWGILLLFPPAMVLVDEARKWIVRRAGARAM